MSSCLLVCMSSGVYIHAYLGVELLGVYVQLYINNVTKWFSHMMHQITFPPAVQKTSTVSLQLLQTWDYQFFFFILVSSKCHVIFKVYFIELQNISISYIQIYYIIIYYTIYLYIQIHALRLYIKYYNSGLELHAFWQSQHIHTNSIQLNKQNLIITSENHLCPLAVILLNKIVFFFFLIISILKSVQLQQLSFRQCLQGKFIPSFTFKLSLSLFLKYLL